MRQENGMLIGAFVQSEMRELYKNGLITPKELKKLQDKEYSKEMFNQRIPVLIKKGQNIKDGNNNLRYYSPELFFGNYHLTNDWYERQWENLLKWLKEVKTKRKRN